MKKEKFAENEEPLLGIEKKVRFTPIIEVQPIPFYGKGNSCKPANKSKSFKSRQKKKTDPFFKNKSN